MRMSILYMEQDMANMPMEFLAPFFIEGNKYFVELWTLNRGKYSRTGLKTGGKYE